MRQCRHCGAEATSKHGPASCEGCKKKNKAAKSRRWRKAHNEEFRQRCKERNETVVKTWKQVNKERVNTATAKRRRDLRQEALNHYGAACSCCGEWRFEFLSFDHINGGGNKHRKEVGSGKDFVSWLVKNNYPAGFRVLCHNCNLARGFYGACPHTKAANG